MRAIATSRIVVFLTRHAGGAEAVAARAIGTSYRAVGRRLLASHEIDPFLAELVSAGIEVVEVGVATGATALALPSPVAAPEVPVAPRTLPKPTESAWLTFSDLVLKTQKIRGPNIR